MPEGVVLTTTDHAPRGYRVYGLLKKSDHAPGVAFVRQPTRITLLQRATAERYPVHMTGMIKVFLLRDYSCGWALSPTLHFLLDQCLKCMLTHRVTLREVAHGFGLVCFPPLGLAPQWKEVCGEAVPALSFLDRLRCTLQAPAPQSKNMCRLPCRE